MTAMMASAVQGVGGVGGGGGKESHYALYDTHISRSSFGSVGKGTVVTSCNVSTSGPHDHYYDEAMVANYSNWGEVGGGGGGGVGVKGTEARVRASKGEGPRKGQQEGRGSDGRGSSSSDNGDGNVDTHAHTTAVKRQLAARKQEEGNDPTSPGKEHILDGYNGEEVIRAHTQDHGRKKEKR